MRDVGRIDTVTERLKTVWKKNPDLRFGQLLLNVVGDIQLYYIEDVDLADKVTEYYSQYNN